MPEQQQIGLVLWEEDVERVHAEEIPNVEYNTHSGQNNLGKIATVAIFGAAFIVGLVDLINTNSVRKEQSKERAEERKKNATHSDGII